MTARDFCYWLQGFFEVHGIDKERIILRPEQVEVIKRHLSMVFEHDIDPKAGGPEKQAKLNQLHHGGGDVTMRC